MTKDELSRTLSGSIFFMLGVILFTEVDQRIWEEAYSRQSFPSGSDVKNQPAMQETQVRSLSWEDPWRRARAKSLLIKVSWVFIDYTFPHSSVGKESACNAGDPGSIPGLGRSPGEGNGNPLQYSCLENPMHREA